MSLAPATSIRVAESFASAVSLVWLMYCLVVSSFFAIADADRPSRISDQTVFCLWLRGEDNEDFMLMTDQVNICIFTDI